MAKYKITYSCGHDGEVNLFGPNKDRDRKIKWLEKSCKCNQCERADHAAKYATAAARASALGLTDLVGSEKQVAWACSIRQQMIDSLDQFINDCGHAEEWAPKIAALRAAFADIILSNPSASWFIENRNFGTVKIAFGSKLVDWVKLNRPEVLSAEEKKEAAARGGQP